MPPRRAAGRNRPRDGAIRRSVAASLASYRRAGSLGGCCRLRGIATMDATRRGLLAGAGTLLLPAATRAQGPATGAWPTRPIRLVVPFAAGGAADSAARAITPVMAQ